MGTSPGASPSRTVLTICAPAPEFLAGLDDLAPAIELRRVVWDGRSDPAPAAVADARFLVAGYAGTIFDRCALSAMPALEVVQLISAGYEDWLAALPPGVTLSNGRGVHGSSTAELAVAGVLSLARDLPFYLDEQHARRWTPSRRGELAGRRVVVIGAGDIGSRVADVLELLGATVARVGRSARDGVSGIELLPSLLPTAEVVVLTVPHTPETNRLVDDAFLSALPDGAILVNVARGGIVDTESLLEHATAGRLSAFLDVTDPEPLPAEHPLWRLPNVLITPHVGGGTERWRERAAALIHEQVWRYASGRPLQNVVAGHAGTPLLDG